MGPLVSIIIPTYNRSAYIGETLDSVISQSYGNWECIVVDDGSTDYTFELMEFYLKEDSRIKYLLRPKAKPKGGNVCRNYGFGNSKGKYIQWLDSDDLLSTDKIYEQVLSLEPLTELSISTCKFGYIYNSSFKEKKFRENIGTYQDFNSGMDLLNCFGKLNEYLPIHVYLTPRELIYKSGLWDENIDINQDGEFYSRVLINTTLVKFVNTGVYYRKEENQSVSSFDTEEKARKAIETLNKIDKNIGIENTLYVRQAKKILYKRFLKKFPNLIDENIQFFKPILPFYIRVIKIIF